MLQLWLDVLCLFWPLALLSILLLNSLKVYAFPLELTYDDGDFDYAWSDFYPSGAAVRFTLPALPWGSKNGEAWMNDDPG